MMTSGNHQVVQFRWVEKHEVPAEQREQRWAGADLQGFFSRVESLGFIQKEICSN